MQIKSIPVFEEGDVVVLVKDARFGGTKKKFVKVTRSQTTDGFFMGDVIHGTTQIRQGYRFHYGNVRLATIKELKSIEKTMFKTLKVPTLDSTIIVDKNKLIVGCQKISMTDANKIADFIKSLSKKKSA